MPKPTYGPAVKARSLRLLADLLRYTNGELEDCQISHLNCRWEDGEPLRPKLIVKAKLRSLVSLTQFTGGTLTTTQIREALKRWQDFLNILEDHRVNRRGSDQWHFTLTLWSKVNIAQNLKQAGNRWEQQRGKQPESPPISPPPPEIIPVISVSETEPTPAETQGSPCRATELAEQLRQWFDTLGYRFETHAIWQPSYFEWLINVPVWRSRYMRVLVRGVAGEVGLLDLRALRDSVRQQHADEGWLVTTRRIARVARDEVAKPENKNLGCYTFDELLDQDADFSRYLIWLQQEIQQREIDRKYVPLACTKEEFDPATGQRIGVSRYDERDGWIDGYIDLWLHDPAKKHISILGEFGTGKTWFAFHYAWRALQRYQEARERGIDRPRLPLVIPLRDYAKAVSVESLFSEFFFRKHEIPIPGYSAFEQLNRMGKLLLIFDGFDEMAARVDRQQMINNFWELAKAVVPGAKVILTCRTEHFPEAKEGRRLLNAELQASVANLTGEPPQFEVLELEKFGNEQIRQVLSYHAQPETVKQVMKNQQLLDLARRPVMVELIVEALPDIEAGKPVDISRIYFYAIARKMERDIKTERTFTSMADKLYFLCELSWEMLSSDRMSLNYREFPDRIRRCFGEAVQEQNDLDHWHYDMMGQTMLIRNEFGDYYPAHRSLSEFFAAYKLAAELDILAPDFAEIGDLSRFNQNGDWYDIFGKAPLAKAVIDLILPMIETGQKTKDKLLDIIKWTQGKSRDVAGFAGGNAATLLVKLDPFALEYQELSCAMILGGDFTKASLRSVDFAGATLEECIFTKVLGFVWSVVFSPDNKLLATGDSDCMVHLWDTATGKEVLNFQGHTNRIYSVAFSPDGKYLASGSADRTVKVWDVKTGECLQNLRGHTDGLHSVSFSPSGKILASAGFDCRIKFWDIETGECWRIWQGHESGIWSINFSHSGQLLVSGSGGRHEKSVKIWDVKTGKCIQNIEGHDDQIRHVMFTPDDRLILSGSRDGTIQFWRVETGECVQTIFQPDMGWRCAIALSPQGNAIAIGTDSGIIKLLDIKTGQFFKTLSGHTRLVTFLSFSKTGTTLASGGSDQTIKLWDIATEQCLIDLQGVSDWITHVSFHPNGTIIASATDDGIVKFWDLKTDRCIHILNEHTHSIGSLVFSPSGDKLATGSEDQTIKIWDFKTGNCLTTLSGHNDYIDRVDFVESEDRLVSGSKDGTVKVWDLASENCLQTIQYSPYFRLKLVAKNLSNRLIAIGRADQGIFIIDLTSGDCFEVAQLESKYYTSSMSLNRDKIHLALGDSQGKVKIYNLQSGTRIHVFEGHGDSVNSVYFNHAGNLLASGSTDHTIRLWDVKTGECIRILSGHNNPVFSVAWSPDDRTLISGSSDRSIKVWDGSTGECLKTLSDRLCEGMKIADVKGLSDYQISTLKVLGAVD